MDYLLYPFSIVNHHPHAHVFPSIDILLSNLDMNKSELIREWGGQSNPVKAIEQLSTLKFG